MWSDVGIKKKNTVISDAQWDYIKFIESKIGVFFNGKTRQDASEFIDMWKDEVDY